MKIRLSKNNRIVFTFLSLIMTMLILFLVLFNILMNKYVVENAKESLEYYSMFEYMYYSGNLSDEEYDEFLTKIEEKDEDMLFVALYIYIDIKDISSYNQLGPFESDLCLYIRSKYDNTLTNQIYQYEKGNQNAYYIVLDKTYMNEDSDTILYVDVSAVLAIISTVNKVLIVIIAFVSFILIAFALKSKQILDDMDMSQKRFFSNASHELKTPLMSIQGYAEGIENKLLNSEQAASIILKESDRMNCMISDMIELSKLDSGIIEMHMDAYDIREIIYDAIDINSIVAKKNNITFNLYMDKAQVISCDENALFSVFTNIISNAIRYAESFINIKIIARKTDVQIFIENDGYLDKTVDLDKIFDRFYKGEKGNTGIGLSIAKQYLDMHKANIKAVRKTDMTRFIITIPKSM